VTIRRGRLARSGALSLLALVALGLTRLIHGSVVSRVTDQATYATVGTLIGIAMAAGLFLPGGLASAASKFIPYEIGAGNRGGARSVRRRLGVISVVGAAILGGAALVATRTTLHLSWSQASGAALLTAAFSVYSVEKGVLYGFDRVTAYVRLELTGSAVAIATTIVVVAIGARTYLLPLILGYTVLTFGAWWLLRSNAATAPPRVAGREVTEYVTLASVGGVASAGFLQALPLLAGRVTRPVEVAYLVAAITLIAPLYLLPRALSMALFPALAHAHGAGAVDVVRRQTDLSTRALIVLLAPLFGIGVTLAHEALLIFGGTKYGSGAPVLQILLIATYIAVIQVAAVNALSAGTKQQVRIPVSFAVIGCLVGLAAVWPLGRFGAIGVGVAYLIGTVVGAAGPLAAVARRYRLDWSAPLTSSMLVVGLALAVSLVLNGMLTALWADLAATVVVLGIAAALLHREIREVVAYIRPGLRSGVH
jgi:O-antigen/teichoic acid export membrane protein